MGMLNRRRQRGEKLPTLRQILDMPSFSAPEPRDVREVDRASMRWRKPLSDTEAVAAVDRELLRQQRLDREAIDAGKKPDVVDPMVRAVRETARTYDLMGAWFAAPYARALAIRAKLQHPGQRHEINLDSHSDRGDDALYYNFHERAVA